MAGGANRKISASQSGSSPAACPSAIGVATYGAAIYGLILLFRAEHEAIYRIYSDWRPNIAILRQYLRFGLHAGVFYAS